MKTRFGLAALCLVTLSVAALACGGAIDPGSSSSSSGASGTVGPNPTGTGTSPTPTTTSTTTPYPPPTTTTSPPGTPPFIGTWSGTASGCSNFVVFAADTSAPRWLVVKASKTELGLGAVGSAAKVDLSNTSSAPSTDVGVDTYSSAPMEPYCTDVAQSPAPSVTHGKAVQGVATFTVTAVSPADGTYTLTVTLQGVLVRTPFGDYEQIPDMVYSNVVVGWLPG